MMEKKKNTNFWIINIFVNRRKPVWTVLENIFLFASQFFFSTFQKSTAVFHVCTILKSKTFQKPLDSSKPRSFERFAFAMLKISAVLFLFENGLLSLRNFSFVSLMHETEMKRRNQKSFHVFFSHLKKKARMVRKNFKITNKKKKKNRTSHIFWSRPGSIVKTLLPTTDSKRFSW